MIKVSENTYARVFSESQLCEMFIRDVAKLKALGYYKSDFQIKHIPNEKPRTGDMRRDKNYIFKQIRMGMVSGAADYDICYKLPGESYCRSASIEFKKNKSCKLTANQKIYRDRCLELGKPYLCTYDIDEALAFMKALLG